MLSAIDTGKWNQLMRKAGVYFPWKKVRLIALVLVSYLVASFIFTEDLGEYMESLGHKS